MTGRVIVVGAGPTGLMAANLLGRAGVEVTVLERHPATSEEAKAISLDGESFRTLQRAGLSEMFTEVFVPGTGTRYYDRHERFLFAATGVVPPIHGHPFKNPFAQPDLERALCAGTERFDHVSVRFDSELTAARQSAAEVIASVREPDGTETEQRADFLVAADGGRSTVRTGLGIALRGASFSQRWLVVDTVGDPHDQRYGIHVGDPGRPRVIIPGRAGRCRYEFLLLPDDPIGEVASFEQIERLLGGYRRISPDQVERSAVYSFHALNAECYRDRRMFLAGDAAHMMPPFAGQGLNSGIRDVANLTWKLGEVIEGRGGDELLATYEAERRPHAQAMIDLSVRLGQVVMTQSRLRARVRDVAVRAAIRAPAARRWLGEMRYAPRARYADGLRVGAHPLVGELIPQPGVLLADGQVRPLDEVLGPGYAILAVERGPVLAPPSPLAHPLWRALSPRWIRALLDERFPGGGPPTTIADYDGRLARVLNGCAGRYVLLRPDRFVAAVFEPGSAQSTAEAIAARVGWPAGSPYAADRWMVPGATS